MKTCYEIELTKQIIENLRVWVREPLPNNYSAFLKQKSLINDIICCESFRRAIKWLQENNSGKADQLDDYAGKIIYHLSKIKLDYKGRDELFEALGTSSSDLATTIYRINFETETDTLFKQITKVKNHTLNLIDILQNIVTSLMPEKPAETEQEIKIVRRPKLKKRGRPRQYTEKKVHAIKKQYDKYILAGKNTKKAWNKAAEDEGVEKGSGKAAEMAVRRYLKKNK